MKRDYLVIFFLLLGPILDVFAFYGTSVSVICRGLFLGGIILYLLINKRDLKIVIPLLLFGIINFFYQFFYLKFSLSNSLSATLKFIYLPVMILYFKDFVFSVEKGRILSIIFFSYIGIYLISYIAGFGTNIYLNAVGKSGFKGVFLSINEFSAILIGLLPIVTFYLKENKKYVLLVLSITFTLICSLLIGTKILMGGTIFCIFYLLFSERKKIFFDRSRKSKILIIASTIMVVITGLFLFTKTITYQNMIVQNNFFKVKSVLSFNFVNKVVFNDRLSFLGNNFLYFIKQDISKILLGIGIFDYNIKLVEIDIFDIIFRYGIIGFCLYIYILIYSIKKVNLKQEEKLSILLLIFCSLTSGHVLIYPAVCIYISILMGKNKIESRI